MKDFLRVSCLIVSLEFREGCCWFGCCWFDYGESIGYRPTPFLSPSLVLFPPCSVESAHPECILYPFIDSITHHRFNVTPFLSLSFTFFYSDENKLHTPITCFEGRKEDFSSSKGDVTDILSEFRHRCISTSGFLEDGGWMIGMTETTAGIVGIESGFRSSLGFVWVFPKLE